MTAEAEALWDAVYPLLSKGQPGMLAAICARAEAQTVRLASIYALLDRSRQIVGAPQGGAGAVAILR